MLLQLAARVRTKRESREWSEGVHWLDTSDTPLQAACLFGYTLEPAQPPEEDAAVAPTHVLRNIHSCKHPRKKYSAHHHKLNA
jgi:hypothetical protein